MKAVIFAAGLGTRLAPLTDSMPKALVTVGGVPALERVIRKVADAGITDIIVNVHHFPDMIRNFLKSKDNFGLNIRISDESDLLLDTGGGILKVIKEFSIDEPVLLHNADILADFPLRDMIDEFNCCSADALLLAWDRKSSRRLLFDSGGLMKGWKNMSTGEVRPEGCNAADLIPLAFGGMHIVSPTIFKALEDYSKKAGKVFSITPFYIENCGGYRFKRFAPFNEFHWWDIGRPETLKEARDYFS